MQFIPNVQHKEISYIAGCNTAIVEHFVNEGIKYEMHDKCGLQQLANCPYMRPSARWNEDDNGMIKKK